MSTRRILIAGFAAFLSWAPYGAVAQKKAPQQVPAVTPPAASASAMLRIACDGASTNAVVTINGVFKGECSVDAPVAEGTLRLRVVKQVDGSRERVFEQEIRMAAGTVKRIDVELGPPQLTANARREEEERTRQQQALAQEQIRQKQALEAQRVAQERQLALEREQKEIEARQAALQAAALTQNKAEAGDVLSILQLATQFEKSSEPASRAQAANWYRKAADLGSAEGMGGLGATYFNAQGAAKDDVSAESWWRKGAAGGDGRSMSGLGLLYSQGTGGLSKDFQLAQEWLSKAVEKGSAVGMRVLATYHREGGIGLRKNEAEAASLYQRAALLGDKYAMTGLGFLYEHGWGVPRDDALALSWYRKAAALGEAGAMNNIGNFFRDGLGGLPQSHVEAVSWHQKSAALGDEFGMMNLGRHYLAGVGIPQNDTLALMWFRKSAALGNATAKEGVRTLEAKGVR